MAALSTGVSPQLDTTRGVTLRECLIIFDKGAMLQFVK